MASIPILEETWQKLVMPALKLTSQYALTSKIRVIIRNRMETMAEAAADAIYLSLIFINMFNYQ